jgi:O-antigen/teichoic acid export membrane protein
MAIGRILYKSIYWKCLQFSLSFLVNLLLARLFQSALSAEFYSLVYLLSLFTSFFSFGLDISLNYYLSRRQLGPGKARKIILCVSLIALLISLPLLTFNFPAGRYPDLTAGLWLLFPAWQISGVLLTNLCTTIFTAYGRNYLPAKYAFVINAGMALLVLLVPRFVHGPLLVKSLFFLYFVSSFLQGVFLYIMASIHYPRSTEEKVTGSVRIGQLLRFSFMAFLTNFIFFVAGRLCIYWLPYRVAAVDLGNYIQAYKLVEYLGLAASFIYYPFIALVAGPYSAKKKEKLLFLLVRVSNTAVLLSILLLVAVGAPLLPLLYGHSFVPMYGILLCFIPGFIPVCTSTFFTAYFYGTGHLKYNLVSGCLQLVSVSLLFPFLTALWGGQGAALSFSFAALVSMGYDCVMLRKIVPYKAGDLLLTRIADWRLIMQKF